MDEDTNPDALEKRRQMPTLKAMEEALQRHKNARKAKLGKLTEKRNKILDLMEDDGNVEVVETKMKMEFNQLFGEFCETNTAVKEALHKLNLIEEMTGDQQGWFEPKADTCREFCDSVARWSKEARMRIEEANKANEDVNPGDSVSVARSRRSTISKSSTRYSVASTASSTRLKAELERATLLAKAEALKQRQALDEQEVKLKAKKEQLEMNAAIAATNARIEILQRYECSMVLSSTKSSEEGTNPRPIQTVKNEVCGNSSVKGCCVEQIEEANRCKPSTRGRCVDFSGNGNISR